MKSGWGKAIPMTKVMTEVWTIYKFASKLTWMGIIEAKTEKEAIEKAAEEFKVAAKRPIAQPTR
jgi:hypothetical protein